MKTHAMHHPKANIHPLYLPKSNRGMGFTQLVLSYKQKGSHLFAKKTREHVISG